MEKALAEGTIDARLFTHAGVIEAKLGRTTKAESWLTKARSLQQMLLPSEQQQLAATRPPWRHRTASSRARATEAISSGEEQIAKASVAQQKQGTERPMKTNLTKLTSGRFAGDGGAARRRIASSHMDAPLITLDPAANTTDVYAFVDQDGAPKEPCRRPGRLSPPGSRHRAEQI